MSLCVGSPRPELGCQFWVMHFKEDIEKLEYIKRLAINMKREVKTVIREVYLKLGLELVAFRYVLYGPHGVFFFFFF